APASTDAGVAASLEAQQVADAMEKAAKTEIARGGASYERAERAALADFYRERGWRPFFVGAQDLTAEGRTLARVLSESDLDGLEPTDYALTQRRAATPEARAEAEFAVAETALRWVRHIASGRFDPSRLSDLVTPRPPRPDPVAVLRGFAGSHDLAATLTAWAPPHEGYRRLKAELARLRAQKGETPMVRLPEGPMLSPGQKDERVALLRERMGLSAVASDADPDTYDPTLAEAVKAFQRDHAIVPSGKIGRTTLTALNEEAHGPADVVADVIVNMERWRWLPRDLGELHVFVNIPDYHLDVMKDGRSIHHARVITGRPENQTPIFSETMEYVVVNPYWNVPQSIVKKEMLAKLQSGSLGRSYEVEVQDREVDPGSVDWSQVSPSQVSIRQRPGDGNALGNIKFMFPNQHSVYIHDTSSRGLFARDYRALSHGCVRVAEPFSFADALLSEEPTGLDGAKLKKLLGRGEQQLNLKRHIPVHIGYFTEFVDDAGQLQSRRDVYGHDAKMRRILGL
ncbi:MAG: L,D-transpeptidase family protein, partial [Phyllobacteriaceae bacterium]|nr:L,D-transpeptidase family protein [Phyllobacteriaceae bacterium]